MCVCICMYQGSSQKNEGVVLRSKHVFCVGDFLTTSNRFCLRKGARILCMYVCRVYFRGQGEVVLS